MNKLPTRKLNLSRTTVRTFAALHADDLRRAAGGLRPGAGGGDPICSCAAHCSPESVKYCP